MLLWINQLWLSLGGILAVLAAVVASIHVVLRKRDSSAALGWVGIIWLVPLVGPTLYALLGVNRIQRRAVALRGTMARYRELTLDWRGGGGLHSAETQPERLRALASALGTVTKLRLLPGNLVESLLDGEGAFPPMLQAIEQARASVRLATYIFDDDELGRRFAHALARAKERGVEVRVLIDAAGVRYSSPPIDRLLKREGVRVARFMPAWLPWRMPFINLRNHRKLLIVDGELAFTGGINLRQGHLIQTAPRHPIRDLHFKLQGPIVEELERVFAEDWEFSTGEALHGQAWIRPKSPAGPTLARAVVDGPDENFETLRFTYLSAIACATHSVDIMTPYFLPDTGLVDALNVAALRGVRVRILVPRRGNLRLVDWAMWGQLAPVLQHGCRVYCSPPPFDHAKLLIVDRSWVLLGSANWDLRSLRLNFELNVECYDEALAQNLESVFERRLETSPRVTLADLEQRPLPIRLRDGTARLLAPYL